MSQKIYTNLDIKGNTTIGSIANATTDTDKFLVSDNGLVKYRTGAEMLSDLGVAPGVASNVQHQVKAGVAINKGQAVYVTSADGTNMIVGLASNASEATSSKTMGLLNATVAINGFANVITEGLLAGLNTIGATAGDPVWLGTGGNLIYGLTNKPYAPAHLVFIGIVTRVNANNGEIFVKAQNGFELDELHDVDLKTTTPVSGHILGHNGTLWVNKTIAGWLGYTPANASGTTNYVSKFTGSNTLGNSQIFDNGTNVLIGTTTDNNYGKLRVSGGAILIDNNQQINSYKSNGMALAILKVDTSDKLVFNPLWGQALTGYSFTINGSEKMSISAGGSVTAIADMRAPIFYDLDNTAYYLDPASTSNISRLLLNGAPASSEASLSLGAEGTNEGGQLILNKATSYTYAAHLDVWQDVFRILYGTNTASTGGVLSLNLASRQLVLHGYTSATSYTGTAVANLAVDASGNVITVAAGGSSGVTSIIAGTGVSVSSSTGAVTVSIGQSVATSANPTFNQVITTNNGGSQNIKLGDDTWIGDTNLANTLGIVGQQNSDRAYISFGSDNTVTLGRIGTGALTWGGNTIWHAGNDGSGSGLDADLLDGLHASDFALASHTHPYDNYQYWNLKTNGVQRTTITSNGNLDLVAGTNVSLSYGAGGVVTISSTDTNTVYTHPAYTARNIDTSGAQVIDIITSDAIGSITNITTRTLTPGDIGAQPAGSYLTTETDTLATVTGRGATTSTLSTFDGGLNIGNAKLRWGGTTSPTLGFPFTGGPNAFWIDVNDGDTGGIAIDNDGTTIYGAGDSGHVFRVIDEDVYQATSNVLSSTTFQVTQGQNGGGYIKGNFDITNNATANSFIKIGGNGAQFLMADGTVSTNPGWLISINSLMITNALGYTPWHAGNDGSGSGLDADTLDGYHASSFLTSYSETDTLQTVTTRGATTDQQVSFTKTNDHAISVGTIRGRSFNGQSGEYIHLYERVHIGSPSGWGSRNAPSYGLSTYGGADFATDTGFTTSGGSMRAPIFYDSDNTNYYADLNATSDSAVRQRGGTLHGPNPTWGKYLLIGGDGRQNYTNDVDTASVCATDGNLHIDAASGKSLYLNFYDGNEIYLGNGASGIASSILNDGSHRPQIIYDYNNTGYYLNPDSTSNLNALNLAGDLSFGSQTATWITSNAMSDSIGWNSSYGVYIGSNTLGYSSYIRGNGTFTNNTGTHNLLHADNYTTYTDPRLYRGYSSSGDFQTLQSTAGTVRFDQIGVTGSWSNAPGGYTYGGALSLRGDSFGMQLWGSHTGDFYFKTQWNNDQYSGWREVLHSANYTSFAAPASHTHTFDSLTSKSSGTGVYQTSGDFRAPIFYDSNDTAYYVDPSNTALSLSSNGIVSSGSGTTGGFQNRVYVGGRNRIWSFGNADAYGISYFQGGPDYIGLHLGTATQAGSQFWVSDAGIAQVSASMRAPIFYDSSDTSYSWNPATDTSHRFTTPYGYVDIGPKNGGHCHMYTDRPSFYFNQELDMLGNRVLHAANYANYAWPLQGSWKPASLSAETRLRGATSPDGGEFGLAYSSGQMYAYVDGFFYQNEGAYRVIDTNSIGSYAPSLIGSGASGTWNINTTGDTTGNAAGIYTTFLGTNTSNISSGYSRVIRNENGSGGNPSYAPILHLAASDTMWQIAASHGGSTNFVWRSGYAGTWSTPWWSILHSGLSTMSASGDFRAPIFYDSDNTSYYLDPTSTTQINNLRLSTLDSAITWTNSTYMMGSPTHGFRFNDNASSINALIIDNSGNSIAYASHRAPIFYDTNNTGFYMDPTGTSNITKLYHSGNIVATNFGYGQVGLYSSVRYQAVFSMGESYMLPADGTSIGNLYGMAWSHPNAGGVAGNLNTHGLLVTENGSFLAAISGSIRSRDDMRAPIFYDSDNTGYYVNPASTSSLNVLAVSRAYAGYDSGNADSFSCSNWFRSSGSSGWYNQTHAGGWYMIDSSYVRSYNDKDVYTGGYFLAGGSHRAPIFYDSNDTTYYINPADSTTAANFAGKVQFNYGGASSSTLIQTTGSYGTMGISTYYGALHTSGNFYIGNPAGGAADLTANNGNFSILYDRSNTAYYFDGNNTGDSIRVAGDIVAYYSDDRLKDRKGNIENALEKVLSLNGFYYEANKKAQELGYKKKMEIGVSAQEVEAILPELIKDAPIGQGYKTLNYGRLTPLLIEAIKEQQEQIKEQQKQIEELKELVNKLITK